jgi:hypothetical protein
MLKQFECGCGIFDIGFKYWFFFSFDEMLNILIRKEKEVAAGEKLNSRILVVSGSSESTAQYMSFMNVFFTAQKQVKFL